jgi:hypothetical protein
MSGVRFLGDEHIPVALLHAIRGREPAIDFRLVGQSAAPPKGTSDPQLLLSGEAAGQALITMDKSTMIPHISQHIAGGHHTWGVFILKQGLATVKYVDDLFLVWVASEAEDWRDRVEYLPWPKPP